MSPSVAPVVDTRPATSLTTTGLPVAVAPPLPSPSLLSPGSRELLQLSTDCLAHLFSTTAAYQTRALNAFYHPQLATYADQFVAVQGVSGMQLLFNWYFPWLCRSTDLHIDHVTVSPSAVTFSWPPRGSVKKSAQLVVVDCTLRCQQLTFIGRVLRTLRLLPAPTYLATAADSSAGIRFTTKLYWMAEADISQAAADLTAPPLAQTSTGGPRDHFIVHHTDVYRIDGAMSAVLLYPVFWLLLLLRVVYGCWLSVYSTLFGDGKSVTGKWPRISPTSLDLSDTAVRFKYVVGAVLVDFVVPAFQWLTRRPPSPAARSARVSPTD